MNDTPERDELVEAAREVSDRFWSLFGVQALPSSMLNAMRVLDARLDRAAATPAGTPEACPDCRGVGSALDFKTDDGEFHDFCLTCAGTGRAEVPAGTPSDASRLADLNTIEALLGASNSAEAVLAVRTLVGRVTPAPAPTEDK